jgi:hypothetical protein
MEAKKVYQAISFVQADLCEEGITKGRRNSSQGYNFRGIDDVYNVLSPILAKHGLCIVPRMINRTCEEVPTKSGGSMRYVVVEAEFDLVSSEDGSSHTIRTFGEAMDTADKATNKAMSAAYKYAAFQAFAIPTEGNEDADAVTPEPAARSAPVRQEIPSQKVPWRQAIIHVGQKFKGQPLANLPEEAKIWFLDVWRTGKENGSPSDRALLAALNEMEAERKSGKEATF